MNNLIQLLPTASLTLLAVFFYGSPALAQQSGQPTFRLNDQEYFQITPGTNVMAFQDIYPEGHQSGVSIIQNGVRVATGGDLRLDTTPGQWQPMPKQDKRVVNKQGNEITTWLSYPDPSRNRTGFNPIDYPDLNLSYHVRVRGDGKSIRVVVDLDRPLPAEFVGRVGFNFELYPTMLFGKSWYLGSGSGIFPRQANGPEVTDRNGEIQPEPFASGRRLTVAAEEKAQQLIIESLTGDLQLLDGRNKHNNGWFVVRSLVPAGATTRAIEWILTPYAIPGWKYQPVVHVSQVGYHPKQKKLAIIELDSDDDATDSFHLKRVSEEGGFEEVLSGKPEDWGKFLRYRYRTVDFSRVTKPGMYVAEYRNFRTHPFQISADVYKRGIWQPVLEYFLPVQMCHMRVEEQYRVWHGACHLDDARMAPVNYNHFDGYLQGPSTLSEWKSGQTVPGLNVGGWHDAGDEDMRIESQADEVSILANAYEAFGLTYDDTTINQSQLLAKIHHPDGKADVLQQVEHGVLTILAGYKGLGRLYRGIIVPTLPQYVLLGDQTNSTDNLFYDSSLKERQRTATQSSTADDRLVFTEQNSGHEFKGIAALAIAGRTLKEMNPALAKECVGAAEALWKQDRDPKTGFRDRVVAAVELWLTTKKPEYGQVLLDNRKEIVANIDSVGWSIGKVLALFNDRTFNDEIRKAVAASFAKTVAAQKATPFGVPYKPHIWGAGWDIQRFGVEQYFLNRAFPDIVSGEYMLNALNFVLGIHPGENTASFASGVGARSMTTAYGFNRADWSYIPGGVASGTALIRPDLPELKDFPYLWQQAEYVMGGGSSNYMFLVLAADQVLNSKYEQTPAKPPSINYLTPTKANYLRLAKEVETTLRQDVINVWFPRSVDTENGGFYSNFTRDWKRAPSEGKFSVFQGRMTWVSAQLVMRDPESKSQFIPFVEHGFKYLRDVMWDKQYGGFFWGLGDRGEISKRYTDGKHLYGMSFCLYGATAAYQATLNPQALELAKASFLWMDKHAHDSKDGGYFEWLTRDGKVVEASGEGSRPGEVPVAGFPLGQKSMNTHIHLLESFTQLYQVWKNDTLRRRLDELVTIVRDRICREPGVMNLYFTPDWRATTINDSYGHDVETAYLLLETEDVIGSHNPKTERMAKQLVDHSLDFGWDDTYGGFYREGKAGETAEDRRKEWWAQMEGLNALLLMHEKHGRQTDVYFKAFQQQWEFIKYRQVDHEFGGFYDTIERDGTATNRIKARIWKEAYHDSRSLLNVTERLRKLASIRGRTTTR